MSFAIAALLASTQLAGSCVDGVTPDCSDAAVCAPSSGRASSDGGGSVVIPEASVETGADAEAGLDADADGG